MKLPAISIPGAVAKYPWSRLAAVVGTVLLAVVYFVSWRAPSVGLYRDDGVYAVTAKALAEGHGYRIISLPHEIPQTKYPFLFPAALSVIWRFWPDFPGNVTALKTLPLLCSAAWFVLSYKLLLRMGAKETQAWWIVLLLAASPLAVFLSTNLMSEPMFGALLMGALLAANSVERSDSDRMAWLAGILAALAFLTRTIGVSLLGAIPLALILRRRYGAVRRFLAAAVPIACAWPLWVAVAIHPAVADRNALYYSSANYGSWNILTNYAAAEKAGVLLTNILLALAAPATLLELPVSKWMALFMLFILAVACARKILSVGSAHLSVAAYLCLCLCWAWPPARFIAVILPLILFVVWDTFARFGMYRLSAALAGAAFCFVLTGDLRRIPQTISNGQFGFARSPAENWAELSSVFSWLRNNTPKNSVLLANLDPSMFLYTGRKSMLDFIPDSRKLFYAPGRSDDALGSLEEIIRSTSANFLVVTPDDGFVEVPVLRRNVERFMTEHPKVLDPVSRPGSNPDYRIYRIRPGL
jgi:hypothetical protein